MIKCLKIKACSLEEGISVTQFLFRLSCVSMSHQNKREIIKQRERQRQESGEAKKLTDAGLVKLRVFI